MFYKQILILLSIIHVTVQLSDEEVGKLLERIADLERKGEHVDSLLERVGELEENAKHQEERFAQLEQTCLLNYGNDVSQSKRFVMNNEGPVAFTAAVAPITIDHVQKKQIIKFETIITEIGGGYNNQTGVFVAPVSGIYMFSCSLLDHKGIEIAPGQVHGSAMLHAEIVQNQKMLGRIFAHAETSYRDQGAQTVFTHADQGDQVWIRNIDNNDLGLGGEFYSTFSGYLLYPMYSN